MSGSFWDLSSVPWLSSKLQNCYVERMHVTRGILPCSQGWPNKQGLNTSKLLVFYLDPSRNSAEEFGMDLLHRELITCFLS